MLHFDCLSGSVVPAEGRRLRPANLCVLHHPDTTSRKFGQQPDVATKRTDNPTLIGLIMLQVTSAELVNAQSKRPEHHEAECN